MASRSLSAVCFPLQSPAGGASAYLPRVAFCKRLGNSETLMSRAQHLQACNAARCALTHVTCHIRWEGRLQFVRSVHVYGVAVRHYASRRTRAVRHGWSPIVPSRCAHQSPRRSNCQQPTSVAVVSVLDAGVWPGRGLRRARTRGTWTHHRSVAKCLHGRGEGIGCQVSTGIVGRAALSAAMADSQLGSLDV